MFPRNKFITRLTIIFFLGGFTTLLMAQEESISFSSSEEKVEGEKNFKYFDIDQYEQTTVFKVNFFKSNSYLSVPEAGFFINSLGIEHKLKPELSIDLEGMFNESRILNSQEPSWVSLGMRYYGGKRASAKPGNYKVNNFTGGYLKANYEYRFKRIENPTPAIFKSSLNLSYGWQQKVGKWGYLDISGVISYATVAETFSLSTRITGGLGFGKSTITEDPAIDSKNKGIEAVWSKSIIFISNPSITASQSFTGFSTILEAEFPIKNYWTFRPSITGRWLNTSDGTSIQPVSDKKRPLAHGNAINIQLRKYLGVIKRLGKGKNSSAFSGYYMGLSVNYIYDGIRINSDSFATPDIISFNISPVLAFGWQQKIGTRFLFDINYNLKYDYITSFVGGYADFKVGILLKK